MSENGKENGKGKVAMYWAASCGGCEISFLNIGTHLLDVDAAFDIVFLPCVADFKYDDVRGYEDGYIDICLFNGAIRNSENEEVARLLRRKSKVLIAFGSCAYEGCIPALSNLTTREATLRASYLDNVSTDNPEAMLPQPRTMIAGEELELPEFYETVKSLDQVVDVDFTIPGCPPEPPQIWAVLQAVISGAELPPPGSILGAGSVAVCEECALARDVKKIDRFYRPQEKLPEPEICLLEQGFLCMGPATRAGCGALCPQVGMGCRGCYGPLDGVEDQGARMLSAVASVMDVGESTDGEAALEKQIQEAAESLVDPAGTLYRFSMAHSLLRRTRANGEK